MRMVQRAAISQLRAVLLLILPAVAVAETHAVVVAGLGGEPRYEQEFRDAAQQVARQLDEFVPHVVQLVGERANRNQIETILSTFASEAQRAEAMLFVFVGHGTFDGRVFRFVVPGKDFTANDLKNWLAALPQQHKVVLATGSASGALHAVFEGSGIALYTATRSASKKNAMVFPLHFTRALSEERADIDKDELVSIHEAFLFASAGVAQHFETAQQLAGEHARHSGSKSHLVLGKVRPLGAAWISEASGQHIRAPKDRDDPALQKRLDIEGQINALRGRRSGMEPGEYFSLLQELLLELAMVEQQIQEGKIGFDDIFAEQPEESQ